MNVRDDVIDEMFGIFPYNKRGRSLTGGGILSAYFVFVPRCFGTFFCVKIYIKSKLDSPTLLNGGVIVSRRSVEKWPPVVGSLESVASPGWQSSPLRSLRSSFLPNRDPRYRCGRFLVLFVLVLLSF